MAKKLIEHWIYCSGPDWDGDGTKSTSSCPFGEKLFTVSSRFKCSGCIARRKPTVASLSKDKVEEVEDIVSDSAASPLISKQSDEKINSNPAKFRKKRR